MSLDEAKCPRCGYCLEGAIRNTQHDAWLLLICCSECGIELTTRDCIAGYVPTPAWVFDGPGRQRLIQRWFSTSFRILVPVVPWRTLTLSAELHLLRLIGWWVSLYVVILLMGIGLTALATYAELENAFHGYVVLDFFRIYIGRVGWPLSTEDLWLSSIAWAISAPLVVFPIWFTSYGMLWLLPVTRRRCKILRAHLDRLAFYSSVPFMLFVFANPLAVLLDLHLAATTVIWIGVLLLIYLPFWWIGAVRFYLRMPHAVLVVFLMLVMALLTEVTVFFVIQHWTW